MQPTAYNVGVSASSDEAKYMIEADSVGECEFGGDDFIVFTDEGTPTFVIRTEYVSSIVPFFDGEAKVEVEWL